MLSLLVLSCVSFVGMLALIVKWTRHTATKHIIEVDALLKDLRLHHHLSVEELHRLADLTRELERLKDD